MLPGPLQIPGLHPPPAIAAEAAGGSAERLGLFEETWQLTNKFFVDRSYNGNDWNAVHDKYSDLVKTGKLKENDATTKVLKLLGDKYTRLIPAKVYQSLSKFDLVGAGVMLSPNQEGRLAVASPPMAKSSAEKFGIEKGDLITAINGMSTAKMDSFDVIDFLSTYQDPTITFSVAKEAGGTSRDVVLERKFQDVSNPIEYKLLAGTGGHKVGYIKVSEFNAIVTSKLREAVTDLQSQGADEYILDLRGNGGGAFQSALGIAGLFMDDKVITYVVDGNGEKVPFSTKKEALVTTSPMLVWMDKGSASASEVLAGALHDDCRALVMGKNSFGKGLIQAVYGLGDGSGLIITVAKYETPRGTSIQGTGITPDVQISLPRGSGIVPQNYFDMAAQRQAMCPPFS